MDSSDSTSQIRRIREMSTHPTSGCTSSGYPSHHKDLRSEIKQDASDLFLVEWRHISLQLRTLNTFNALAYCCEPDVVFILIKIMITYSMVFYFMFA